MLLITYIICTKKANELYDIIDTYWIKIKQSHEKNFQFIHVGDSDAIYLGLQSFSNERGIRDYQDMLNGNYKHRPLCSSFFFGKNKPNDTFIVCTKDNLNEFLFMCQDFVEKINQYISLKMKMKESIPYNIKNITETYTQWIEEIEGLKIYYNMPYLRG